MKKAIGLVALLVVGTACPGYAEYSFSKEGVWPSSWPQELEPLRKQSRSITGPRFGPTVHEIPFTDREQFESVWPHILKLKSEGARVILVRSPHAKFERIQWPAVQAGVRIVTPSGPYPPDYVARAKEEGVPLQTETDIELVVDGKIVDLNRIRLPAETPIVDRRFTDE